MKIMAEERKESPTSKSIKLVNDLLMKPFSLGWTREVVRRGVTHNNTPNCDIYYFNPSKKKLRSMTEVKNNLTDGLTPECFSFKRQPLGLSPELEIIRDAKLRRKVKEKSKNKTKISVRQRKPEEKEQEVNEGTDGKEEKNFKPNTELVENERSLNNSTEKIEKKNYETKSRRAKSNVKVSNTKNSFSSKKKTKTKATKLTKPAMMQAVQKRKSVLKRVMNAKKAKQSRVVPCKKVLKQIVKKAVKTSNKKLTKIKSDGNTRVKSNKTNTVKLNAVKKPMKNSLTKDKNDLAKPETNDTEEKSAARDLKSIVQKNIGKYREMREKEKLVGGKSQLRNISRKKTVANIPRMRSEPISKNKPFYLKPLEKGWRRELVFRTNCAKAGQQADVYYFHPNGKKLRSCREIAENLTHGLSIECFTFRKEPLGCGEPSEVIRNARSHQRN